MLCYADKSHEKGNSDSKSYHGLREREQSSDLHRRTHDARWNFGGTGGMVDQGQSQSPEDHDQVHKGIQSDQRFNEAYTNLNMQFIFIFYYFFLKLVFSTRLDW